MSETVVILGGTREAAELADRLVRDHPEWRIITSLAGRTAQPKLPAGETRIGGFGGAAGLADYLRGERATRLIDATHPFARTISANAAEASRLTGIPLETVTRPAWPKQEADKWIEVASLEDARAAIPTGSRVLLAIGSQHLSDFASRRDVHFVVRMVDPPTEPLPFTSHKLVTGTPGTIEEEMALLTSHAITHVVCRNSGGNAGYAKIAAARKLGLPVVMIGR